MQHLALLQNTDVKLRGTFVPAHWMEDSTC